MTTARWLPVGQVALYLAISPLVMGSVEWLKARIQGRRGPSPLQLTRDLVKLLRVRPSAPGSASAVFALAPSVVFASYLLLGLALPMVFVPDGPGPDLLLVVALIGLAKFATTLAAFDAGAPLGPMSSGRQWFIHVLAEPGLLVATYIIAIDRATTDVARLALPQGQGFTTLLRQPAIPLAVGALLFVLLAETGRLPFDRPGSHLELTMIEEGVALQFSGRALALMTWGAAMKLTFSLSLVAALALPPGVVALDAPSVLAALAIYLGKLGALVAALAWWETSRGKLQVRAVLTPLMLAAGVLIFTLVTLVVTAIKPGS